MEEYFSQMRVEQRYAREQARVRKASEELNKIMGPLPTKIFRDPRAPQVINAPQVQQADTLIDESHNTAVVDESTSHMRRRNTF